MQPPDITSLQAPDGLSRRARWAGGETIVSTLMARTLAQPELVSLAAGFVDHATLPLDALRTAIDFVWAKPNWARDALQYGTTIGYPPLRQAILDRTLTADGTASGASNLSAQQVVITAGSNQFLYLVGDALLDAGDIILCGAPTYFVYLGTLTNLAARAVGVDVDDQGVIPDALEEQLRRHERNGELGRVKAVYLTTYYDNPTGTTIPADRRARIVDIAKRWSRRHRIYVLEDVAYRELRYHDPDVPSMLTCDPERNTVVQAGSFSKSFSPGVRVGWGILPKSLLEPVLAAKGNIDFGSPNFNQVIMSAIVERGLFDEHIASLREAYRKKLDATLEACDAFLGETDGVRWVRPGGGLYVWIRLPERIDTGLHGPLFDRAVAEGVLYVPGVCCFPPHGRPPQNNLLRLSFGIQSEEAIRRGIDALARAVKSVM